MPPFAAGITVFVQKTTRSDLFLVFRCVNLQTCLFPRCHDMKPRLLFTLMLTASQAHALELEPIVSLKGLFKQVPERLGFLSPEERRLRSEFDRVEGGIKNSGSGVALVTSEQDMESYFCALPNCTGLDGISMTQDRGGLAWNLSSGANFRLAPKAEFVRYEMSNLSQPRHQSDLGFGLGLDSIYRFGGNMSAYASAGMLQLSESSGYEGLFGVSTQLNKAKLFVEARWADMGQQDRLDAGYEYSNVRIGISREFSGL